MKTIIYFTISCLLFWACTHQTGIKTDKQGLPALVDWTYADTIKEQLQAAVIPPDTFVITQMGLARGAGQIQQAIDKVAAKGGGTLVLPVGVYHSGAIHLKSHTELHLAIGAVLKFIPDASLYPLVYTWFSGIPCYNFSSMIYARNQSDIKISGQGTIDGQGYEPVWKNMRYSEAVDYRNLLELEKSGVKTEDRKFGQGHALRPQLVSFYACERICISGVSFKNAPYFVLNPVMCSHVNISNGHIQSSGYEQIGIAIVSSQYVLVDSMRLEELGEGIKILSGGVAITGNQAASNIIIQNSSFNNIPHAPIVFSSKSIAGLNRIFVSGLQLNNSEAGICFYGKNCINTHDVFIKDVEARNITKSVLYLNVLGAKCSGSIIHDVHFEDIRAYDCGRAFKLLGHQDNLIQDVSLSKSSFEVAKGSFVKNVRQFVLSEVSINGKQHNSTSHVDELEFPKIRLDHPEEETLDSRDIQYHRLPTAIKAKLTADYPYMPIIDIDKKTTSTTEIYEVDFELPSYQNMEVLFQQDGKVIRSELEISFNELPPEVFTALHSYLNTCPRATIFNTIRKISYKDFSYYRLKGEHDAKLFVVGISSSGKVIEQKQQAISSYFTTD